MLLLPVFIERLLSDNKKLLYKNNRLPLNDKSLLLIVIRARPYGSPNSA